MAEVLLQKSRAVTVAKVHNALFRRWPTPASLARARVASIESVIRPIGLTSRAPRLRELARAVAARGVPKDRGGLRELPGVGEYASAATAAVAFGVHAPVVDAVSARVYRRYFGLPDDRPVTDDIDLRTVVSAATPRTAARDWNWAVLDLAAAICTPGVPRCLACPLRASCAYPELDPVRGIGYHR